MIPDAILKKPPSDIFCNSLDILWLLIMTSEPKNIYSLFRGFWIKTSELYSYDGAHICMKY